MAYSEPPLRNMVRLIVTSAYSIGRAPSVLSMVSSDLGAAQRRAAGGAGEDDVLHLAAAQRLGALLAHHPGEGVDDVGLARAVGTDDAGDAGLELERRRGGEGLEALERQALEVQRALPAEASSRRRTCAGRGILSDPGARMLRRGRSARSTLSAGRGWFRGGVPGVPVSPGTRGSRVTAVATPQDVRESPRTPPDLRYVGSGRRPRSRASAWATWASWRQIRARKSAEPTKANQNGAGDAPAVGDETADDGADDDAAGDADHVDALDPPLELRWVRRAGARSGRWCPRRRRARRTRRRPPAPPTGSWSGRAPGG